MLRQLKSFLLRGNVIDLAVAVVIGTAFTAVITALVRDILTPVIAVVAGKHDFSMLTFVIHRSTFRYGDFLNYLIGFVLVGLALFFFVVQPINVLMRLRQSEHGDDSDSRPCTECLSEIPRLARRCAHCTSAQEPLAA